MSGIDMEWVIVNGWNWNGSSGVATMLAKFKSGNKQRESGWSGSVERFSGRQWQDRQGC